MGVWDWLGGVGQGAYNWAGDNPLGALSLGVGAAGTGFGIWDQMQRAQEYRDAQKQALERSQQRQQLAEQFSRMSPQAFAPNFSPDYLKAAYFRPAASFMAQSGLSDGGAFRQALADAAVKAEGDRLQMGNQIYQSRLGALGYGPPAGPVGTLPATGNVGGFGAALQNLMLMNAMRGQGYGRPYPSSYQQTQPGAAYSGANYGTAPDASVGMANTDYGYGGYTTPSNWSPPDQFYQDLPMSQFNTLPGSQ